MGDQLVSGAVRTHHIYGLSSPLVWAWFVIKLCYYYNCCYLKQLK